MVFNIHFPVCRYGGGSCVVQIDEVSLQIRRFLQSDTSILRLGGSLKDWVGWIRSGGSVS